MEHWQGEGFLGLGGLGKVFCGGERASKAWELGRGALWTMGEGGAEEDWGTSRHREMLGVGGQGEGLGRPGKDWGVRGNGDLLSGREGRWAGESHWQGIGRGMGGREGA